MDTYQFNLKIKFFLQVAAVVVLEENKELILSQLREFAKKTLPSYAVPTILKVVNQIPKNSMGKVNKHDIIRILFPKGAEN